METNYQMMLKLDAIYKPKQRGFMTHDEEALIKGMLHLNAMDVLQLHNLRDFVVLYLSHKRIADGVTTETKMELMDKISAITTVIDTEIIEKGGEV